MLAALAILMAGCARTPSPEPRQPEIAVREVAAIPMRTARHIAFLGSTAFVAQNLEGMTALDVSRPHKPRVLRRFEPSEIQPLHIHAREPDTLLIADRFRGLVVWRVRRADEITSVASLDLPGMLCHLDVFSTGGPTYAAVASGGEGMSIVDITNLTSPSLTARFLHNVDFTRQVAVRGRHAFVADNMYGGMKIVDLANPADPILLFRVSLRGFCDALALRDDLLFAAYRNYGTRLFRISAPADGPGAPLTTSSVELLSHVVRSTDRVRNVLPLGRLLVLANDTAGVEWYDCSDPYFPVIVAEWRAPDAVMSVAERQGLLYVAAWNAGVRVLKPAQPDIGRNEPFQH